MNLTTKRTTRSTRSTRSTRTNDSQSPTSTQAATKSAGQTTRSTGATRPSHAAAASSTSSSPTLLKANYIAQAAIIAATYAAATLICNVLLEGLAMGPVQFRLSEAICVVATLTPAAIPGLTIGCVIANLANIAISATGVLGLLDVVFGSLATFIGACICWKLRARPAIAISAFVVTNALIVPAYLPILLAGLGYYTIPFTTISLEGAYFAMYAFGVVSIAIGEAVVIYVLGWPLYRALAAHRLQ